MTRYLIDIRMMGPVKNQVQELSDHLVEKFHINDNLTVPHITLAGPFEAEDETRLTEDFTWICSACTTAPAYEVGGYGFFDATRVIYVTITPDDTLRKLRHELAQAIAPYCSLRNYDQDSAEDFRFHATLAMKLDWLTYQRIKWYFRNQEPVVFRHHPIRVTLLKNSNVLCEYDFVQQRMLTASQARSKATLMRDLDILKAWGDGKTDR
ncbi:MAG: 2'-5' RNA ligase family protein [Methanomicrobiales archaeon]|nr:2'-5' RNA ligase family protein [Methanomicrobiales archaeon]